MSKHDAKSQGVSIEKVGALAGFITEFLVKILSVAQIEYWLKNKTELKEKIREAFSVSDEYVKDREGWEKFYKTHFNWTVDFSGVIIPEKPTLLGQWRLLFIAQGMTMNLAWSRMVDLFRCWKSYDNLDKEIKLNKQTSAKHYAIWIRDGIEPDEEFRGQSTEDADPNMDIGMTFLEREILEIAYFSETSKHLDIEGVTFCSGSRYTDGDVPSFCWDTDDSRVGTYVYSVGHSNLRYGIRRAVR